MPMYRGTSSRPPHTYGNGITVTLGQNLTVQGKTGNLTSMGGFSNTAFENDGTIRANTSGGTITITLGTAANPDRNAGTIATASGGTISASVPANYTPDGTLTGGTWQVYDNSTLRITMNAGLVTNAANILLDGANSHFYTNFSTDALAALTTNAGSLTVQNGRAFTSTDDLTKSGTLLVGPGGTVIVTGTYTEAGTLNVRATGLLSVAGALANFDGANLSGGTYRIAGTFQFPGAAIATNAATLVLDGSASQIIDQNGNDALAGLSPRTWLFRRCRAVHAAE